MVVVPITLSLHFQEYDSIDHVGVITEPEANLGRDGWGVSGHLGLHLDFRFDRWKEPGAHTCSELETYAIYPGIRYLEPHLKMPSQHPQWSKC